MRVRYTKGSVTTGIQLPVFGFRYPDTYVQVAVIGGRYGARIYSGSDIKREAVCDKLSGIPQLIKQLIKDYKTSLGLLTTTRYELKIKPTRVKGKIGRPKKVVK